MFKKLAMTLGAAGLMVGFIACNSDSDSEMYTESILSSSTQVTAFSLNRDDSVLVSLDSVYFSIDLKSAEIFNADSLPYGTRVDKLVANITFSAASSAELSYPRPGKPDSVVDYLHHSTDSIDFSNGPVKFKIVAGNGETERTYTIKVNVHNVKPDSLCWGSLAYTSLPTDINAPKAQRTVLFGGNAYCLTTDGAASGCMAVSANPADRNSWEKTAVGFGFTPDVASLAATTEALYILDDKGALYTSADGISWSATGTTWHSVIGGYGKQLLGVAKDGDAYTHVTYPATTAVTVNKDFPVDGTSQPMVFETKWGSAPQLYVLGGVAADGSYVADTWGYDGKMWQKVSATGLPAGLADVTVFPYHSYLTNTNNWSVTGYEVLIAMGGRKADGVLSRTVYISYNMGLVWREASELMQLPAAVPSFADAQALVFDSTLQARSGAAGWVAVPSRKLPPYYMVMPAPASRAVKPIDSWDCPYIYLFGGVDGSGELLDSVWRGVLNRLTFKPLQ